MKCTSAAVRPLADEEALPQSDFENTEDVYSIPSDSDDEDIDANAPGPSNIPEVKCMKKRTSVPEFSEFSGPSEETLGLDDHSPLLLLLALFSISLMEVIVSQKNLYSTQQENSQRY
ncbi:hypothetical protein AVEN_149774-1 [Araneus ventricosus]|uniref:Uncharacterized protein n=1 Tax=Araneus ventricosus TaxID=182803 RepID=A0A4Y2IZE1_ARAVE|nr:hypothetical protein AVEN_149774-1 [Araneus ventricosus]